MPPLRRGEARRFASALAGGGVRVVFAHSSYLINLASADARVRARSVASLGEELRRCAALGLPYLVLHPGAHGGQGERIGIRLIAAGLDDAFQADPGGATRVLLETTAGRERHGGGSSISRRSSPHPPTPRASASVSTPAISSPRGTT